LRLETLRVYGPRDLEEERKRLLELYDNLDSLTQKANIIGCTRPAYVDDYMLLRALSSRNPSSAASAAILSSLLAISRR